MATYFGSDGSCKVVTSGGSPASLGELLSWSLTMTADTVDSTTMGRHKPHIRCRIGNRYSKPITLLGPR